MPEETPAQASTPRPASGPPLKRFCRRCGVRSDTLHLSSTQVVFVEAAEKPSAEELDALAMAEARHMFEGFGHPDAGPLRVTTCDKLQELPSAPVPDAADRRPLLHWKISAVASCEELRSADPMSRVFGWPETPPQEVMAAMEKVLASDAVTSRGYGLSYVEVTELLHVTVQPTHEPLGFVAR